MITLFDIFESSINTKLKEKGIEIPVNLFEPPSNELGDFCFVVNQIAGKNDPQELANQLEEEFEKIEGIATIVQSSRGSPDNPIIFLNFTIDEKKKTSLQKSHIKQIINKVRSKEYGIIDDNKGKSVIVEHTSANPISTLHVGNLRNSVQGDTFARILEQSGYTVYRHFYVNDVGLQISFVVIGYELAKNAGLRPPIKIDVWLGQIYAIMNCFYNIQKLKRHATEWGLEVTDGYEMEIDDVDKITSYVNKKIDNYNNSIADLEEGDDSNQLRELKYQRGRISGIKKDAKKYNQTFNDLKRRFPNLFRNLFDAITDIDLINKSSEYLQKYETNEDEYITNLFREVVEWNIQAFSWTLNRYNIDFDSFDYESDLTWSGLPEDIINKLAKSKYATVDDRSVRYSYPQEAMDEYVKALNISKSDLPIRGKIPDLQLRRSDGTALYAAKDIAYSIQKFKDRNVNKVFNVISAEQTLPQFQLLMPLHELGLTEYSKNLYHYSYELVDLRGRTMSGRLAQYITADDYYDETLIRARIAKREADKERGKDIPDSSEEWDLENETLRAVTLASTRFPLVETAPNKRMELDLDRELDFKRNAGPFVQYAHARANSLLKKVEYEKSWQVGQDFDTSKVADDEIVAILGHLDSLEDKIRKAVNTEDPSQIATWCFELAQQFMKFYEKFPILKADEDTGKARLQVASAIKTGLKTGLSILGIPAAEQL